MPENPSEAESSPRVWTPAGLIDDDWRLAASADELAANSRHLVPLATFLEMEPDERERHAGRLGVIVEPGEALEPLAAHLGTLALVALRFPAFTDGRSYSKAVLLRTRHGYEGDVRAMGDILVDQIPHMLRCGFSSLEVTNAVALARLETGDLAGKSLHYQAPVRAEREGASFAWRRRTA